MKNKLYLIPAIIATLAIIICIALKPIKAKADYLEPVKMTQINAGFDKPFEFFQTSYDNNFGRDYTYIDFRTEATGGNYAYMDIDLGSDNANIKTIIVCMISNGYTNNLFFGDKAIECGFYTGMTGNTQAFDEVVLPYYIPKSYFLPANQNSLVVAYVDVSKLNIEAEGSTHFLVRYTKDYRLRYGTAYRPQVMFWDLEIEQTLIGITQEQLNAENKYNYDFGYNNGYDDGIDAGYDMGYEDCLDDLYRAGGDYQFGYDAGKEAGIKSNSIKLGQVISSIFNGMSDFLNIKVFGDFTLGALLTLPIVFGAIWIVLKLLRG